MTGTKSPYLSSTDRLADVIAALQATATYKFYQLTFDGQGWGYRITGNRHSGAKFRSIFEEHPEFFRIDDTGKGSLVIRRQRPRLYDVDRREEMGQEAYKRLNVSERGRISRSPLDISELATLINTAIELHARAVAHEAAGRWWIAPLISVVSAFTGALVGGLVAS